MFESTRAIARMVIAAVLLASCLTLASCGADASLTIIQTPTPAPSPTATPDEG